MARETPAGWADVMSANLLRTGPAKLELHTGPPKVMSAAPLTRLETGPRPVEEAVSSLVRDLDLLTAMVLRRQRNA